MVTDDNDTPGTTGGHREHGPWAKRSISIATFLFTGVLVFRYLWQQHRSNVWKFDGIAQHFPALYYYHSVVVGLLKHSGAPLPMWSWHLGLGADTLGTLSYYFADPFAILSIGFPTRSLELAYLLIYFVRLACAGLVAYVFLRELSARRLAATAGALIYVFATYTMFSTLSHPYFANPMVYLPVLLLGIEYALKGRRQWVLVLAVALSAASNFYFFYQLTIVVLVYATARYFELAPREERWSRLGSVTARTALYYTLGVALAAVLLVPVIETVLSCSRSVGQPTPLLASTKTYLGYVLGLTSSAIPENSAYGGFAACSILMLPALYLRRRRNLATKSMVLVFFVFLAFPFFGSLFNGMLFPSYRILFGLGLFLAAGVAALLSDETPFSRVELAAMFGFFAAYSLLVGLAVHLLRHTVPQALAYSPLLVGWATWLLLALEAWFSAARTWKAPEAARSATAPAIEWFRVAVVALVIVNIGVNAWGMYSPRMKHTLDAYLPTGTVLGAFGQDPGSQASGLPSYGLDRVEKQTTTSGSDLRITTSNDPLVQGYNGTMFYYSIMSSGVYQYVTALDDRAMRFAFDFNGFDDRATLLTLNAVRYYIADDSGLQYVPYGFAPYRSLGGSTIYQNTHSLPVGFVYHSMLSHAVFDAMTPLERQQAMLDGVVLDTGSVVDLPPTQVTATTVDVPFSAPSTAEVRVDRANRVLRVARRDGRLTLDFTPVPDAELYIDLLGVNYAPHKSTSPWTIMPLRFGTRGAGKLEMQQSPAAHYFRGDRSQLVNLGYFASGADSAYVQFPTKNTYTYGDLHIYAVPMREYARKVHQLQVESMRDVIVTTNSIRGRVTAKTAGFFYLSIPYSPGWSAIIDGKPVTLVRANLGFMGAPIPPGDHSVELRYATPGIRAGLIVSIVSAIVLIVLLGLGVRRRRNASAGGGSQQPAP